jgi:hypothetical protein
MSLSWENLRPRNNSQNAAFEELCCQLASYEHAPTGSSFTRVGAPDAGVECYWQTPSGDEWGWQAKFFKEPPKESQWKEIDGSVMTALKKHPRLVAYVVCLPIDRHDPRTENQIWMMDKWNARVARWTKWAETAGMSVSFSYWGQHQIAERLAREEHRGRHYFWFNKELFSDEWFRRTIDDTIANVGPRYTPELNVELPIAQIFGALGRIPAFHTALLERCAKLKKAAQWLHRRYVPGVLHLLCDRIQDTVTEITSQFRRADTTIGEPIPFLGISQRAGLGLAAATEALEAVSQLPIPQSSPTQRLPQRTSEEGLTKERIDGIRYQLNQLTRELHALQVFIRTDEAELANKPAMLLVGDAGKGKTHLLCDVAKHRNQLRLATLLFLGSQFALGEPWGQIIQLLGLKCTKDEFLGAMDAAAHARRARALIFIDALNEGEARNLWSNHLAGWLNALTRYPNIGVVVSVRTSYENIVIPEGMCPKRLVRIVHHGFAEHEFEATKTFFRHYRIERPSVPLLVPEFQNPLFLKLFCQGLNNRGMTRIPSGLHGITRIFQFFIESVNEKLAKPEHLDFDPSMRLVQKAVDALVAEMANLGQNWLRRDIANDKANALLRRESYDKSLFRGLLMEGVIMEDRWRTGPNEHSEVVRFAYERFSDHLIAGRLLTEHLNERSPAASFRRNRRLGAFLIDERAAWMHRGIIEAFSIQLPERIQKELPEVAPHCAGYQPVRQAFIASFIWRDPNSFSPATRKYLDKYIFRYSDTRNAFLDAWLTVATNPSHPYNAMFLHRRLMQFNLPDRDA